MTELPTENLKRCPVCTLAGRRLEAAAVSDLVHRTVAGRWHYHRCFGCHSVYLDPRPTEVSIAAAYASYHTHAAQTDAFATPRHWLRQITRAARNADVQRRYGYDLKPRSPILGRLLATVPPARHAIDSWLRGARRRTSTAPTVLDVGCGNGNFLATMRSLGWQTHGVELDPTSAAVAASAGIDVTEGSLSDLPASRRFDLITLNHVIEHVHEPRRLLDQCFDRLAAGGQLWLATPNIDGLGFRKFGRYWRGLEAPRHLVLFNPDSLRTMLQATGFTAVAQHRTPWWAFEQFRSSASLRQDGLFSRAITTPLAAGIASVVGELLPARSEELLFTASRG